MNLVFSHHLSVSCYEHVSAQAYNPVDDITGRVGYVAPGVLSRKGHGKPVDVWSTGYVLIPLLCAPTFIIPLASSRTFCFMVTLRLGPKT